MLAEGSFPNNSSEIREETQEKVQEPDMYRVLLHNDHYTTMEFVVEVLIKVFQKSVVDATKIMMNVHQQGKETVGQYTYDIAQTKVTQVRQMAQKREYPLKCTLEKV